MTICLRTKKNVLAKDFVFSLFWQLCCKKQKLLLMLHIIVMETYNRHFVFVTTGQVYGSARCLDANIDNMTLKATTTNFILPHGLRKVLTIQQTNNRGQWLPEITLELIMPGRRLIERIFFACSGRAQKQTETSKNRTKHSSANYQQTSIIW